MKKTATILFISLMCFMLSFCCLAAEHTHGEVLFERSINHEETVRCTVYSDNCVVVEGEGCADFYLSSYWYDEYFSYEEREDYYIEKIYLGEGITSVIDPPSHVDFIVDENNPYLSSDSDGSLYSKDKTQLFYCCESGELYTIPSSVKTLTGGCLSECNLYELVIPESVETIEPGAFYSCYVEYLVLPETLKVIPEYAFEGFFCECIVLPSTVEKIEDYAFGTWNNDHVVFIMNPDCQIGTLPEGIKLIGYTGSTAEQYADENSLIFDYIDNNHSHIYVPRVTKLSSCTQDGILTYNCPCGNATPYVYVNESFGHFMDYDHPDSDGNVYCTVCGQKADCNCLCHSAEKEDASKIEVLILKILTFFWKLFRINEECACGNNFHY